jgi:hypothetical protein
METENVDVSHRVLRLRGVKFGAFGAFDPRTPGLSEFTWKLEVFSREFLTLGKSDLGFGCSGNDDAANAADKSGALPDWKQSGSTPWEKGSRDLRRRSS